MGGQSERGTDLYRAGESPGPGYQQIHAGHTVAATAGSDPQRCHARAGREGGCGPDFLHQRRTRSRQVKHGRLCTSDRSAPSQMMTRSLAIAVLAFIGLEDAVYLSIKRNAGPIPCHATRGGTDVLTTKYSGSAAPPLS